MRCSKRRADSTPHICNIRVAHGDHSSDHPVCVFVLQRAALEARKYRKSHPKAVDSFLEELVVRRELSDNYCYYQPNYDNVSDACECSLPDFFRFSLTSFST